MGVFRGANAVIDLFTIRDDDLEGLFDPPPILHQGCDARGGLRKTRF